MNEHVGTPRGRIVETEAEGDGYYDWLAHTVAIRGRRVRLLTKPGIPGFRDLDPAAVLLAETIDVAPGAGVLALNCGPGLVGAVAAGLAEDGPVTVVEPSCVTAEAARRTLAANGAAETRVILSDHLGDLGPGAVSRVALRLPKGKPRLKLFLWESFRALEPGGRLYLAGGNQEGIKTALALAGKLFGRIEVLGYRKGFRVGCAVKTSATPVEPDAFVEDWLAPGAFLSFSVQVRDRAIPIRSRPGVFSWDRLDRGTARLLETLPVKAGNAVLDLGCGYGLIGVVAAQLAADVAVTLVDADAAAVAAARATLLANQVARGQVLLDDCGVDLPPNSFDIAATNPPFHQGKGTDYEVGRQFVREAWRVLKPGGVLYLVANRFLPYEGQLKDVFGNARQITLGAQYQVFYARKGGEP